MAELKYKYADFNIEHRKVLLNITEKDGVQIIIPLADDAPECVKEKLDQIVNYEFNEYLRNNKNCTLCPQDFTLDADLVLENDKELGTQYFLSILMLDLISKYASDEIVIQNTYAITQDDGVLYSAMKSYFQGYVNNTLFPE